MNKPDIREIMKALDPIDKKLWLQHRTEMRRSYISAHANVIGIPAWDENDDAFLDLIDIKLALLFDRNGYLNSRVGKTVVDQHDGDDIEAAIHAEVEANRLKRAKAEEAEKAVEEVIKSDATKSLEGNWGKLADSSKVNHLAGIEAPTNGDKHE